MSEVPELFKLGYKVVINPEGSEDDLASEVTRDRATYYSSNGGYAKALEAAVPVEIDSDYVIQNNVTVDKLQEDVLEEDLISDSNWNQSSRRLYDYYRGKGQRAIDTAKTDYNRSMIENMMSQKFPELPDDQIGQWGLEHIGDLYHNLHSMGTKATELSADENALERERAALSILHLNEMFETLPMFSWNGTKRFAKGIMTDPTTYMGLGGLGVALKGAGVKGIGKQGLKKYLRSLVSPSTIAAYEGAGYAAADDLILQNIEQMAGVSTEIDKARTGQAAGIGAVAGKVLGEGVEAAVKYGPQAVDAMGNVIESAAESARQRMDEKGTRLMSGFDPTDVTDPLVAALDDIINPKRIKSGASKGQYIGAPKGIDTPQKLGALRRKMKVLAAEGEPGRFWYERSGKAVLNALGGNKEDADKLVQAIAITSAQTGVDLNFRFALQAFAQYKRGEKIRTGIYPTAMVKNLENMFAGKDWEGRKTNNFYVNMMREIDPTKVQGVTTDIWMVRAFGFKNEKGEEITAPTDAQYTFVENEVKRIAKEIGWEPQQVQASIWVTQKANKEGKTVQETKFDFSDALRNNLGQISWESKPGATSGHMQELFTAPFEQQQEYHVAVSKAFLDDDGYDLLAKHVGLLTPGDFEAPGFFEGNVSPGTQTLVALPIKYKRVKKEAKLEQSAFDLASKYAAMRGLLLKQDASAWHRPFFDSNVANANGMDLDIGRPFSPEETERLAAALTQVTNNPNINPIGTPTGVRVINFFEYDDNKEFHKLVQSALDLVTFDNDVDVRVGRFATDSDYFDNDWSTNVNGENYRSRITGTGSSDLQRADRVLIEEIQERIDDIDADFSEKYGWTRNQAINSEFRRKPSDLDPTQQTAISASEKEVVKANVNN